MKCHDVQPLLVHYVDGEVNHYEQPLIEHHLRECQYCSAEVSQLRVTRHRVQWKIKSWAASEVPPANARERLMAQLAAEKETTVQDVVPVLYAPRSLNNLSGRTLLVVSLLVGFAILLIILFRQTPLPAYDWLAPTPSRYHSPHIWQEAIMYLLHVVAIPR